MILPISFYPTQLDIVFTEKCNQQCDYCWVDKSSPKILDFSSIKRAINIFLGFPIKEQTITFTTTEPLIFPDLYKKTVDYILSQARNKEIIHLATTTNGLKLCGTVRDFIIDKLNKYKNFKLNISIDGMQKSHDAHRKLKGNRDISSFSLSWQNFLSLPRSNNLRVIFTITPSEVNLFRENIDFLLKNDFRNIDIFPQVFTLWPRTTLNKLKKEFKSLINYLNNQTIKYYCNLRLLNRLWGTSHYAKLLFGSDAKFYLFEWILFLPYPKRKRCIIGDTKKLNLKKRLMIFSELFNKFIYAVNGECLRCDYRNFCAFPLPLFLKFNHNKYDFLKYFKNFCLIAKLFVGFSKEVDQRFRAQLDTKRLSFSSR